MLYNLLFKTFCTPRRPVAPAATAKSWCDFAHSGAVRDEMEGGFLTVQPLKMIAEVPRDCPAPAIGCKIGPREGFSDWPKDHSLDRLGSRAFVVGSPAESAHSPSSVAMACFFFPLLDGFPACPRVILDQNPTFELSADSQEIERFSILQEPTSRSIHRRRTADNRVTDLNGARQRGNLIPSAEYSISMQLMYVCTPCCHQQLPAFLGILLKCHEMSRESCRQPRS